MIWELLRLKTLTRLANLCPSGQLAAGTCEIVTLDRDRTQPRRTIARQTARCACKKGQIAGTTRAKPACVDGKTVLQVMVDQQSLTCGFSSEVLHFVSSSAIWSSSCRASAGSPAASPLVELCLNTRSDIFLHQHWFPKVRKLQEKHYYHMKKLNFNPSSRETSPQPVLGFKKHHSVCLQLIRILDSRQAKVRVWTRMFSGFWAALCI